MRKYCVEIVLLQKICNHERCSATMWK